MEEQHSAKLADSHVIDEFQEFFKFLNSSGVYLVNQLGQVSPGSGTWKQQLPLLNISIENTSKNR